MFMPWASMFIIVSYYQVAVCIDSRVKINFHDHTGGLKKKFKKNQNQSKIHTNSMIYLCYFCTFFIPMFT